jgi:hypothetical protein
MELNSDLNQSDHNEVVILNNKRSCSDDQSVSKKQLKLSDCTTTSSNNRKKSVFWQYFCESENSDEMICQINKCNKKIKGKYLTNIKSHVKSNHFENFKSIEYEDNCKKTIEKSNLTSINKYLISKSKYSKDDIKQINAEKKLAYFLASTRYPYNIVYCHQFRELLEYLDNKFIIPGKLKLTSHALKIEEEMIDNIKNLLKEAKKVSLTTDLWSCKGLSNSFIAITAHFFTLKDKNYHKVLLGLQVFNDRHTGENVKNIVQKVLNSYDYDFDKIIRIITDNGSNMIKAFKQLKTNENLKKISIDENNENIMTQIYFENETYIDIEQENIYQNEVENDFINEEIEEYYKFEDNLNQSFDMIENLRIPCFAHTLQLIVNLVMNSTVIKKLATNIKRMSAKVHKSTIAMQEFKKLCNSHPPTYCPTRWSSLYLMVKYFTKYKNEISKVFESNSWDHLTVNQWAKLNKLEELLKPFAFYTNLLQGDNYITISNIIPALAELKDHLENFKTDSLLETSTLTEMINQLNNRFKKFIDVNDVNFDGIALTATLLDPKFSLYLTEKEQRSAVNFIEKSVQINIEEQPISSPEITESTRYSSIKNKILSALSAPNDSQQSTVSQEINSFLKYLKSDFLKDFKLTTDYFANTSKENDSKLSPYSFWSNEIILSRFPIISKFALEILPTPATQASSERVFSVSGDCLSGKRNSLNPTKLQREVMLIFNRKYINL